MSMTLPEDVLRKYPGTMFVETGSWNGAACRLALKCGFRKCLTIEADHQRAEITRRELEGLPAIVYEMDSWAGLLGCLPILAPLEGRATFWLDAHQAEDQEKVKVKAWASAGTGTRFPLLEELRSIRKFKERFGDSHILIDDSNCWERWGISTDEVIGELRQINSCYSFRRELQTGGLPYILAATV